MSIPPTINFSPLAICISASALVIGLTALTYNIRSFRRKNRDHVQMSVTASKRSYPIVWPYSNRTLDERRLYIGTEWECVIVNAGERAINIMDWELLTKTPLRIEGIFPAERRLVGGEQDRIVRDFYLKNSCKRMEYEEDVPLAAPIDIPPGVSKTLRIKMGWPLNHEAWNRVQAALNAHELDNDMQQVYAFVKEHKLGIFGDQGGEPFEAFFFVTSRKLRLYGSACFLDIKFAGAIGGPPQVAKYESL